jgi:MtN3 and saliva related transmembrane protein
MIIEVLASIMGIIMSLGYYPQAYKILKHKSAKNVSLLSFIIFAIGTVTWLVYGIIINSIAIILGFALGVIGSWLVLILILVYDKKKR